MEKAFIDTAHQIIDMARSLNVDLDQMEGVRKRTLKSMNKQVQLDWDYDFW